MYVILGASGNTGSVVAGKLLAKGQKVRVVGRDAKRLESLARSGAEVAIADATDAAALTKAFAGAEAVYALIPPNVTLDDVLGYQERTGDAVVSALEKSGVAHAVILSSIGADKADKVGPVVGLHRLEEKIGAISGLNALYLRAGYFMENTLAQVSVIRSMGFIAGPLQPDLPLPMIATRDIGAAAAEALLKRDFQGKTARELLGAGDRSYNDVATVVGTALGKPGLAYQQMPGAILRGPLMQMGMSANFVDLLLQMTDALNSGYMKALEPRSAANTTPTTLETFVTDTFVPAYRGQAATA